MKKVLSPQEWAKNELVIKQSIIDKWDNYEFMKAYAVYYLSHYYTNKRTQANGIKDSFDNLLYEGDIIEYYDWCHANGERYVEEGYYYDNKTKYGEFRVNKLPIGFGERAIENGYTCIQKHKENGGTIEYYKPQIGVVKWNDEHLMYEPISNSDGYFSFFILLKDNDYLGNGSTKSYCKKIGNIYDNPELLNK